MTADDARFSQATDWGPNVVDGGVRFRLWAPTKNRIELAYGSSDDPRFLPLERGERGWWEIVTDKVGFGEGYAFRIDGEAIVPDPAARAQVADVHSFSRLVDPRAYEWKTPGWKGRPLQDCVFYELHVGTFTPEGTFDAVIGKLDYLKDTGITAVELLPVAEFSGRRGWGYDGTLLYCPHAAYGGVEGLKRLVDAAHERGLMVFLDCVYNHFGPDGNYLNAYAPEFFHPEIHTPWGPAIAYDERPVREFMIDNALYWFGEYRIDGLRLDAIDSIKDKSEIDIIAELAARVRQTFPDRHLHLTSEDARNITWHIERNADGGPRLVSAEWNDDFHHCCHVLTTGETEGYYADYTPASAHQLARCLAEGFVYQGQYSAEREDHVGHPSNHLPPTAFVNFIQNHDQIGNRAFGDRLTTLSSDGQMRCLQAILLLSPQLPLIFMGEEYGETQPFCFFTDFHGELGEAVSKGRREEFKKFASFEKEGKSVVPDPNEVSTFEQSRLRWDRLGEEDHAAHHAAVKELLAIRRREIVPLLADIPAHSGSYRATDSRAFEVCWSLGQDTALHVFANLDDEPWGLPDAISPSERAQGHTIYATSREAEEGLRLGVLPGTSVVVRLAGRLLIEKSPDV
ncbi:malto-oligosyltrehalose trehalohydrolase [Aureimonas endophytica]|uniref:Malto-oligosyltrehalose trehalohydrolase n=1 Tax=Aureimonas endophytica TaxID=2027858 RepID=A0A917A038_9HYPH|nr:malto-oligosyltrehalose trehalohydrolase [Aureimonas endophytica]GGE20861.1 malto-oligosyltrehalose trehalohydrolase [Aureimonas endophytica]